MRIFSTPSPVPVLIQSCAFAPAAPATQIESDTAMSPNRRRALWNMECINIVLRHTIICNQLLCILRFRFLVTNVISCNQTRTLPKLCSRNNQAAVDRKYRFAAMPAPPTYQATVLRSTVRPPRGMAGHCDRCQMSHTRDWLPGFEDPPHISASSRKLSDSPLAHTRKSAIQNRRLRHLN